MAYEWTPDLATEIDEIDAQHRELLARLRDLHRSMRVGETDIIPAILAAVRTYAKAHFDTEEQHMRRLGFPGLEAHRAEHAKFTAELDVFEHEWGDRGTTPSLAVGLGTWLSGWFREHIRRFDFELAAFAREAARDRR
jgi:hemerythrin-like metal-binding protein